MPPSVHIGLIGCGQIARCVHLRVLQGIRGVAVTAVADPDASALAEGHRLAPRAHAAREYERLLERTDVDAVVIALPSGRHAEVCAAALAAGKDVYLEKPLATSLADGESVLRSWKRSGRVGMIGFNYRFNRLYLRARDLVRQGAIGQVIAVRSIFSTAGRPLPEWKARRSLGGGVLLDLASHHFDLIRFLLDTEIGGVACELRSVRTEQDTAFVRIRMATGAVVQSFFSLCASDEDRIEIHGTAGALHVDRCRGMDVERRRAGSEHRRADQGRHVVATLRGAPYGLARLRAFGHEPSWRHALEHFVAAVRGVHPASPDLADGFRSLEAVIAAEQAAAAHQVPVS